MPDPFVGIAAGDALRAGASMASGVANGMLRRPKFTLIKLGSRDERREIYSSFLASSLQLAVLVLRWSDDIQELQNERPDEHWEALAAEALKKLRPTQAPLYAEYLHWYAEAELISSPKILEICRAMRKQMAGIWQPYTPGALIRRLETCSALHEELTRACRKDLHYDPPWWQFWRILWRWIVSREWIQARERLSPGAKTVRDANLLDARILDEMDSHADPYTAIGRLEGKHMKEILNTPITDSAEYHSLFMRRWRDFLQVAQAVGKEEAREGLPEPEKGSG